VAAGLRRYDEQRRPRTQAIARRSRRTGAVAQWAAAPAALLRDTAVRLTPAPVLLRSFAPVLDWAPPR
jgi:2-polyprenyl-6-methoxyphenol hydroxylase-like FAD-dependent oxidoreductase